MINAAVFLLEEFVMQHMNTPIDSQQFRFFLFQPLRDQFVNTFIVVMGQ